MVNVLRSQPQLHNLFQNWIDENFLAIKENINTLAGQLDGVIKKIRENGTRADVTILRQEQFTLMSELNTIWEDLVRDSLNMTEDQFQQIAKEIGMEPAEPTPKRDTPNTAQTSPKQGTVPDAGRLKLAENCSKKVGGHSPAAATHILYFDKNWWFFSRK